MSTTPDPAHSIVIGHPVDFAAAPPDVIEAYRYAAAQTGELPAMYDDSVQDTCQTCGLAIWLGPRSAAVRAAGAAAYCLPHAAQAAAAEPGVTPIVNLNNRASHPREL